jgi:hypothetical protein
MLEKMYNSTMKRPPINRGNEAKLASEESLAAAFYPGKEEWRAEPGNRYIAEELREMDRNWDFRLINPYVPHRRVAD